MTDNNIVKSCMLLEFLVFDHEDSDGLLSLDWFMRTGAFTPSERSLKFSSEGAFPESSEKEYSNQVLTENLTYENYPEDCFSEDLNDFKEDWPLESFTGRIELKPIDNLEDNESLFQRIFRLYKRWIDIK
ncbi:hypothetical protein BpHYR1_037687 [Brachionus plicatilis]|uniref:Uncharacterized protein n=1 Tax=Brachionus plicatilis TaxID=10195 RepID=A0A3M7QKV8_BRAPC|nr:hypothetical protein BpHYR1_037687 [Brachionus plicatilis]